MIILKNLIINYLNLKVIEKNKSRLYKTLIRSIVLYDHEDPSDITKQINAIQKCCEKYLIQREMKKAAKK